jgi:hypothetical protein
MEEAINKLQGYEKRSQYNKLLCLLWKRLWYNKFYYGRGWSVVGEVGVLQIVVGEIVVQQVVMPQVVVEEVGGQ